MISDMIFLIKLAASFLPFVLFAAALAVSHSESVDRKKLFPRLFHCLWRIVGAGGLL